MSPLSAVPLNKSVAPFVAAAVSGLNEDPVRLKNVPINGAQELAEISMIRKPHPLHRLIDRIKQRLILV
jgi:hypothetical protein